MVKLSELKTAEEVRADDMQDPEYRREYERTRLANDVAIRVIQYRVRHGLSQDELARRLGTRQPNVARLESGTRQPPQITLSCNGATLVAAAVWLSHRGGLLRQNYVI